MSDSQVTWMVIGAMVFFTGLTLIITAEIKRVGDCIQKLHGAMRDHWADPTREYRERRAGE